jgi:hypothetical protein
MAFSKLPSGFFGSTYDADATTLTLLLSEQAGLDDADADPVSGDSRQILLNVLTGVLERYDALATANKPGKFTIIRRPIAASNGGDLRVVFTVTFDVANVTTPAVIAE